MYQFIETISVKEGQIQHLADHQERMDRTILHFFDSRSTPDLNSVLSVPAHARQGWIKCRVVYDHDVQEITWTPYQVKKPASFALVHTNDLDYSYKYTDRKIFSELISQAETDDIIIVKNGWITDSSYANLLFRTDDRWITPAHPLLPGTQRSRLLQSGVIEEEPIKPSDLQQFDRLKLINALLDMENGPEWSMDVIKNL
ncbi:aminotransferase class IV family protein [Membranicola marinus]|uniref:Aminotransferase class IV family protein n=1 Tax=Membranihabitans marinus TaxID=1227546 RepID=A0A953HXM8_9BACT|nr:aminotransferase class IV family protein [Membranihabitans marinus]MBY5960036.1 aminotransferase class IV family protein [Membranihabitans marinus]